MKKATAMLGSVLVAIAMVFSACTAVSPEESGATDGEHTGEAVQSLTGSHKVCSAVAGGWRDSIVVTNWHPYKCWEWAASVAATDWQLGCLTDFGYSWGGNHAIPSPNCGWAY